MTSLLGLGKSKRFFKLGLGLQLGLVLGLELLQLSVYVESGATLGFAQSSLNLRYDTSDDSDLTTIGTVSLTVPCPTFIIHRPELHT